MKEFTPEKLLEDIDDLEQIKALPESYLNKKVVLGFDIYKYSQFPKVEQIYVPVVLERLYQTTSQNCIGRESFHFDSYAKTVGDFKKNFISTGDGGFQIFETPIQAVIFALFFQANVVRFVSGSSADEMLIKLQPIVHTFELRYAITHDFIYSYKKNFFGPAIINNARILSKDSLNRLLIDMNSITWFMQTINAIENLMDLDKKSFLLTETYKNHDPNLSSIFKMYMFKPNYY